jgi:DNA-binding NtrC family response regulator
MMERVLMLLDDPGMRARFTTEAEEKLKAFTWPRAVHNLETAIETIVHRSGKPARASAGV